MAKSDYTTLLNLPGSVSFFAITAMRDLMLPNMLGEEQHHILYWAGRDLATKLPVAESALPQLFTQVGLGTLSPLKQKRANICLQEMLSRLGFVLMTIPTFNSKPAF